MTWPSRLARRTKTEIDGCASGQATQLRGRLRPDTERPRVGVALPVAADKRRSWAIPQKGAEELRPITVGAADKENVLSGRFWRRTDGTPNNRSS